MFPLEREIYDAITSTDRPLLLDGILRKITGTKHTSRVLMSLRRLEQKEMIRLTGDGWAKVVTPQSAEEVVLNAA